MKTEDTQDITGHHYTFEVEANPFEGRMRFSAKTALKLGLAAIGIGATFFVGPGLGLSLLVIAAIGAVAFTFRKTMTRASKVIATLLLLQGMMLAIYPSPFLVLTLALGIAPFLFSLKTGEFDPLQPNAWSFLTPFLPFLLKLKIEGAGKGLKDFSTLRLMVATVIFGAFTLLLVFSNAWLSDELTRLISKIFENIPVAESVISVIAFFTLAGLWHLVGFQRPTSAPDSSALESASFFPESFQKVILLGLNLLFGGVALVELMTVWIIQPSMKGTSFADFAHRGVYNVAISALLLLILWNLVHRIPASSGFRNQREYLLKVLLASTSLLWASGLGRLGMYIESYGLTQLRIFGIFGFLFVACAWLFLTRWATRGVRIPDLIRKSFLIGYAVLPIFILTPKEALIASWNLSLYNEKPQTLDITYLSGLGWRALPAARMAQCREPKDQKLRTIYADVWKNLKPIADWRTHSLWAAYALDAESSPCP